MSNDHDTNEATDQAARADLAELIPYAGRAEVARRIYASDWLAGREAEAEKRGARHEARDAANLLRHRTDLERDALISALDARADALGEQP